MVWSWSEYYEKKKELQAKLDSLSVGSSEYWKVMKELQALEKEANAQRYVEAVKRTEEDLKKFGKAYEPIARSNLKLAERQWKRDYEEVIRKNLKKEKPEEVRKKEDVDQR